jgi:quercetin dioxygenase-like cupin family protein/ketosteroid isomerase-like protein
MNDNVGTVAGIYAAFGRGDIPWIIDQLADDVAWDIGLRDTGLSYLRPGYGKGHVLEFFGHVGADLEFSRFEPGTPCAGGDTVIVPVWIEGKVTGGDAFPLAIEAHEWQFGADGKVTSFRHIGDWADHERAAAARAESLTGRVLDVLADKVEVLRGGGEYEMFRVSGPVDSGPPPHAHPWRETMHVLDGEVDVMVDGDTQRLTTGDTATVPAGALHTYRLVSPSATFLAVTSGARASGFFADLADNVPAGPPSEASLPVLAEIATRHGLTSPVFA